MRYSSKPLGWRGESHRHYLAAKGISTKPKQYFDRISEGRGMVGLKITNEDAQWDYGKDVYEAESGETALQIPKTDFEVQEDRYHELESQGLDDYRRAEGVVDEIVQDGERIYFVKQLMYVLNKRLPEEDRFEMTDSVRIKR